MSIGKNIKILRASKEIRQKELAKTLGITQNYLSMIENGSKKPSLTLLEKLADILNVPLSMIFSENKFS